MGTRYGKVAKAMRDPSQYMRVNGWIGCKANHCVRNPPGFYN